MGRFFQRRMDFRDLVTRDAQSALDNELESLKRQCRPDSEEAPSIDNDFKGFSKLFAKFLAPGSRDGVVWENIHKAPAESVRTSN